MSTYPLSTTHPSSPHYNALPIIPNVPLANKTWFRTGGLARFYAEPTTSAEFKQALEFAHYQELDIFILGEGANTLIADTGFDGLVIHPKLQTISHHTHDNDQVLVHAQAGVLFSTLIQYCLDHHSIGLEEFSGIPGSIGGSVFINIHYFEFLLSQFLVSAHIIHRHTGIISVVDVQWFNFGYNYSRLHQGDYYLLQATFKLKKGDTRSTAYAQGRHDEIIRHRSRRYPTAYTCGSFFRNFYDHEVTLEINNKKMVYIAYYLDKLGAKGYLSVGDAIVSHQHANMIVNRGKATSDDIIMLARLLQELVYTNYGSLPQPECRLVGFQSYPLIPV